MTFVAAAIAGGAVLGVGGAYLQSKAAKSAAGKQANAANYASDIQKGMFDTINEQQAPYREAGYNSLNRLSDMLPGLTSPVTAQEIQGLPGFQFAMDQGIGATRQNMNVGGGGSNVDRAAQKFAIDYTTSTAMPQVLSQRQSIYNTLAGIAGLGQNSMNTTAAAGQNMATNVGNAQIGAASAIGAGQVGSANAWANSLGNIGNTGMLYGLLHTPKAPTTPTVP